MNTVKVSIGMPVYNGERYLRGALESLLSQSYPDFELVICDNASADGTEDICRAYAAQDERIRYHRHAENIGAGRNFREAFIRCRGEYFKWAAHDDEYAPGYLARCVDVLDSRPEVVLAYSRTVLMDENGGEMGKYQDRFDLDRPRASARFQDILLHLGWCHAIFGLMRARVLSSTASMGTFVAADMVLLAEMAMQGRFVEHPEYLFRRRLHGGASAQANPDVKSLAAWYDPANRARHPMKRTRMMVEYVRAIGRVPMPFAEKAKCYWQMARWMSWWRYAIGAEIVSALMGASDLPL
jgi:glycosyltransferase involved in cell wall biosynthesis